MTIFIASTEKNAGLIKEDLCIKEYFLMKGLFSRIETLDSLLKEVKSGDIVMLKSIWGYHLDCNKFLEQINHLKINNVKLINDYEYIYWNIDKNNYLSEIKFLQIIPTYKLGVGKVKNINELHNTISDILKKDENVEFVIKPSISESGYLTFMYRKNVPSTDGLYSIFSNKNLDFIIQPFRSDIVNGEVSVVIINGKMMYGIKRFPGIFTEKRSLEYIDLDSISEKAKYQIELLFIFFNNNFSSVPKICRVDFVKNKSEFEILEVELIDPDLFFRIIPKDILSKCLAEITTI